MGRTLNLTSLPEDWKTKYPGEVRGKISTSQSEILNTYLECAAAFLVENCGPSKLKESLVRGLNTVAFGFVSNDVSLINHILTNRCIDYYMDYDLCELKYDWPIDISELKSCLGDMYINPSDVLYDIVDDMIVYCGNLGHTDLDTKLANSSRVDSSSIDVLIDETAAGIEVEDVSEMMERYSCSDDTESVRVLPISSEENSSHSVIDKPQNSEPSSVEFDVTDDNTTERHSKHVPAESLKTVEHVPIAASVNYKYQSPEKSSEADRLKKQYTDIESTYGKMSNPYAEFIEDWRNGYPSISLEHRKFPTSSDKIWHQGEADGYDFCIYVSTPIVPAIQNDITITTDVTRCRPSDLVHLFPVVRNYPRFEWMYKNIEGAINHPILGSILPIDDYTEAQLIDNIVKYPVLSGMYRREENQRIPSWRFLEIDGELVSTLKLWDTLPVSKTLPHNKKIVAEYFYRKYLLDRDIKGVEYKYPIEGTMKPYVMLFTTVEDYAKMGYTNPVELGRQCVENRVSYIQTRNPIIRRIGMPCTNV